ncbi:actin-binding ADF family protein [Streptomyces xanthophaeus]
MGAEGVRLMPEVLPAYGELRTAKQHRYVVYGLTEDCQSIDAVERAPRSATFDNLVQSLKDRATDGLGAYAVYDYESTSSTSELVFITWSPSTIPVKQRMLLASAKGNLKSRLEGLKHDLQVNDEEDLTYENLEKAAAAV